MEMDYYRIGQRIRRFRKAGRLSQEQLAETVGISVTHLSHIETGNTKLSLAVFAAIAEALGVQADELLYDAPNGKNLAKQDILDILDSCSAKEAYILHDLMKAAKISLDKHMA